MKFKFTLLSVGALITSLANAEINYQHIRNATAKINVAGSTFLVDPYLAPKGSYAGFEGTLNSEKRNPLIDMTMPAENVIEGVDAVIVTHTHADHWDEAAQKMIPKTLPIFVQNAGDAKIIREQGFKDVRVVGKNTEFNKVKLSKTGGQHGTDEMYAIPQIAELLGEAMGVVMQAVGEKTLYIVGDTIWNYEVDHTLAHYKPEIIVMNTGYAQLENYPNDSIIMGKADVAKAHQAAPKADIITVHMDAVNHASLTSDEMRQFVKENKLDRVAVPKEGEVLKY
ncbi:MBL fold metallo-hydrolase [Rodentibacter trehalosifermentans]|uniref:Metallo-beta-lactamase domain-containing protein n=1 Tax=Rodentibacter trehalosifermentans TaxID=1908263 RepID=A0A1V3IW19_9PAST|nr:MBL fold metallo-hydrolase [Rodentibacter trehalosifermentans]OOF46123.1 hypothetical protein BKK51_03900 [Rodentibacter trehalosifermentans]OOF52175.1 hypothetical protein BKK53_06510 [Rodentibacter trehalosifermentans]